MLTIFVLPYPQTRNDRNKARTATPDQLQAADRADAGRTERTDNPDDERRDMSGPSTAGDE